MADEDDFPKMTLRVYTRTPDGDVKNDSGVRAIAHVKGPVDYSSAFPPCRCPRHAQSRAKVRR